MKFSLFAFLFLLLFNNILLAQVLYVTGNGADSNDGKQLEVHLNVGQTSHYRELTFGVKMFSHTKRPFLFTIGHTGVFLGQHF